MIIWGFEMLNGQGWGRSLYVVSSKVGEKQTSQVPSLVPLTVTFVESVHFLQSSRHGELDTVALYGQCGGRS